MSREEFTELIFYISELKHQYTQKIDEQTIKINDQNTVIEELLWQLRELTDKVRRMSDKVIDMEKVIVDTQKIDDTKHKSCICRYENHIPKNRILNSRQSNRDSEIQQLRKNDNDDDIYETIEFSDSSNIYTEPIKSDYGALRKINIKTTPTPRIRMNKDMGNKETNMKKSRATMNLEKYNLEDIDNDIRSTDDETELRIKPLKVVHSNTKRNSTKVLCSMISGTQEDTMPKSENFTTTPQHRDVFNTLINCSPNIINRPNNELNRIFRINEV